MQRPLFPEIRQKIDQFLAGDCGQLNWADLIAIFYCLLVIDDIKINPKEEEYALAKSMAKYGKDMLISVAKEARTYDKESKGRKLMSCLIAVDLAFSHEEAVFENPTSQSPNSIMKNAILYEYVVIIEKPSQNVIHKMQSCDGQSPVRKSNDYRGEINRILQSFSVVEGEDLILANNVTMKIVTHVFECHSLSSIDTLPTADSKDPKAALIPFLNPPLGLNAPNGNQPFFIKSNDKDETFSVYTDPNVSQTAYTNRYLESARKAIAQKPVLICYPELAATDDTIVKIKGVLKEAYDNKHPFLFVAGSVWNKDGNIVHVFENNGDLLFTQRKLPGYELKLKGKNYKENLPQPNESEINIIDIPGFGRMAILICYDVYQSKYLQLLSSLCVNVLLVISYSGSRDLLTKIETYVKDNACLGLWLNACKSRAVKDGKDPYLAASIIANKDLWDGDEPLEKSKRSNSVDNKGCNNANGCQNCCNPIIIDLAETIRSVLK